MRITAELLSSVEQRTNPLGDRELVLRGLGIATIENLGITKDAFDAWDMTDNRITVLGNLPQVPRLKTWLLSGNNVETVEMENLSRNAPNVCHLTLCQNRISSLAEVQKLGQSFPKVEFLSLVGNPVNRKCTNCY